MKRKDKRTLLVDSLGRGHREQYIEDNPHGFKSVNKKHKNKKKYNRKREKDNRTNYYPFF